LVTRKDIPSHDKTLKINMEEFELLRSAELFLNVPSEQLVWLLENSKIKSFTEGDIIFTKGDKLPYTFFIVSGSVRLYNSSFDSDAQFFGEYMAGDVFGYLPYSREYALLEVRAAESLKLLALSAKQIPHMIKVHYELTRALVIVMCNSAQKYTSVIQQNEKMMALGKLSAGLAHELNNPVSAIVRESAALKEQLKLSPNEFKRITTLKLTPTVIDSVNALINRKLTKKTEEQLGFKERLLKENHLETWLESKEIDCADEVAETFVEYDFSINDLTFFEERMPGHELSAVLVWINKNLVIEKIVANIEEASIRISDLVNTVKSFTHMDRGRDKQLTDIHSGINNTLKIFDFKLKEANISLIQSFENNLPEIDGVAGDLNQVWTNLIDNAIDAMEINGRGTLTIKTQHDSGFIQVSISDDGPGMPDAVKSQAFDPFFTTKDIGKGSGMGLEVVHRVIKQHNGSVQFTSQPGKTEFSIRLPINANRKKA
jgi:signal transduction histidine kinase